MSRPHVASPSESPNTEAPAPAPIDQQIKLARDVHATDFLFVRRVDA